MCLPPEGTNGDIYGDKMDPRSEHPKFQAGEPGEQLHSPSPSGGLSDSNYQIDQVERQARLLEPWGVSKLCCEGGLRKPGQLKALLQQGCPHL